MAQITVKARNKYAIMLSICFILLFIYYQKRSPPSSKLGKRSKYVEKTYEERHHYDTRNFDFMILIKSAPEHIKERTLLRKRSWLSHEWKDEKGHDIAWRHFFVVGRSMDPSADVAKVRAEEDKFGDLLVAPYLDEHTRQTYKVMWAFRHILDNFTFKFLFVIDEDVIVNVQDLYLYMMELKLSKGTTMFYGGSLCTERIPERSGVFAVSLEAWPRDIYPTFCDGSALLYSHGTIVELVRTWDHDRQPVVPMDDIHIGVLIFLSGKIGITEIPGFSQGCQKLRRDSFVIQHIQPLETGVEIIERYLKEGFYCHETRFPHARVAFMKLSN